MESSDNERLEPVRILVQRSFRLDPDKWQNFVSESSNKTLLTRFMSSSDYQLFFHLQPDSGLQASLGFPSAARSKVVSMSRAAQEGSGKTFRIQEISGGKALGGLVGLSEEVSCPLLSGVVDSSRWAVGVAPDAIKLLEQQKNAAQVVEARVEGLTFLPPPWTGYHDDSDGVQSPAVKTPSHTGSNDSDGSYHDDSVEGSSLHDNQVDLKEQ